MKKKYFFIISAVLGLSLSGCNLDNVPNEITDNTTVVCTDGNDGTSFLTGNGEPSSSVGNDGDTYLDLDSYDLYTKNNGNWSKVGNIKGTNGQDGTDGTNGHDGTNGSNGVNGKDGSSFISGQGVPSTILGNDGDAYLDTDTYDLYTKNNGAWSKVGNIKGADGSNGTDGTNGTSGVNGKDGSSFLTGHGTPSTTLGNDGDTYLDLDTYDLYSKNDGVWSKGGNIKGTDGEDASANKEVYTVTFIPDNGEAAFTQEVEDGKKVKKPDDPVKTGYSFEGWYASTDEKWVFSGYQVTEDMTLTAKYLVNTYIVTLDANGGNVDDTSLTITYGTEYTLPTPTYAGHTFEGWLDEDGNVVNLTGSSTFAYNQTLTASWGPLYTVTFDSQGGSACEKIEKYDTDAIATLPIPTKAGYVFDGWYLGDNLVEAPYTPDDYCSVTLIAKYTVGTYTITFDANGGTVDTSSMNITFGEEYTLPTPTYAGHVFDGWKDSNNNIVAISGTSSFTSNQTLTAIWEAEDPSNVFTWSTVSETDKTIAITGYSGSDSDVVVPEKIKEQTVVSIGDSAFENLKVTSITLPNTITTIENYAFYWCNKLTSINIPSNVTSIGSWAFEDCVELTAIVIPDSVTSIGYMAFHECTKLVSVTLSKNLSSMDRFVFNDCTSLSSITFPETMTSIPWGTFYGCTSLTSFTIGRNITSIGNVAFHSCSGLTTIYIPSSVVYINDWCFEGCSNLTINCEVSSTPSGWSGSWNASDRPVNWGVTAN